MDSIEQDADGQVGGGGRMTARAIAAILVGLCACEPVDRLLGGDDEEFVAVDLGAAQPTDPTHGVIITIEGFAAQGHHWPNTPWHRQLAADVNYGTLLVQGSATPVTSLCERFETDSVTSATLTIPTVVLPQGTEALVVVSIVDGDNNCTGQIRKSTSVIVRPPVATPPADASGGGG